MKKFELVVPAYNESQNLEILIKRAIEAAKKENLSSEDFQFVIVNNGSKDNSTEILSQLANSVYAPWFRVVNVAVNQGYGFGLWQGLKSTTAPIIAWSHADMQCDPADAIKGFKQIESSSDKKIFIKGIRSGRDWKDKFVSRVFELFSRCLLGLKVYEINAQPKVFPKELLSCIKNPPNTFAFDMYVLYQAQKAGFTFKTIPVLFPPRIHGVSNWAAHFSSRYKTILGMIHYMIELRSYEKSLEKKEGSM
ncbi:MAG: glycosyltransferase family 2 protein [Bdellovibrionaceae bacterium]|nr:glycosyltransferase family 2 protein [Pseudobdellovibrionaceae bacterium]